MVSASREQTLLAKQEAKRVLANVPGINGIGLSRCDGGYELKINISEDLGDPRTIPEEIAGVRTSVHMIGRIRRQTVVVDNHAPIDRERT